MDTRRPWRDLVQLAQVADAAGLRTVFVPDHFMPMVPPGTRPDGDVLEAWTTLSALASSTATVRLGTLVLGNSYRHPAVVANMAATLDQVSAGRMTLGLGAGWQPNEHAAYGIDLPPAGERVDRFEEAVQVVRALLLSEEAAFEGDYYRLTDARCEPKPVQRPLPLLLAGGGERRSIPIAARYGDAWHAWTDPDGFRHKSSLLDAACVAVGREPSQVRRLTGQVLQVSDVAPRVEDDDIIGPADHVVARLEAYRGAGVDEFIVRDHAEAPVAAAVASLESLATDVVPALG